MRLMQTQSGLVIVTIDTPTPPHHAIVCVYDTAGRLICQSHFTGRTTTVLPHHQGMAVITVMTSDGITTSHIGTQKIVLKQ